MPWGTRKSQSGVATAKLPPFDPNFRLDWHCRRRHGATARMADRAVLIELTSFLAVISAVCYPTPHQRLSANPPTGSAQSTWADETMPPLHIHSWEDGEAAISFEVATNGWLDIMLGSRVPSHAAKDSRAAPLFPSRNRRSARSRSWRIRSRVTPSRLPISSSVCSRSPSRPK